MLDAIQIINTYKRNNTTIIGDFTIATGVITNCPPPFVSSPISAVPIFIPEPLVPISNPSPIYGCTNPTARNYNPLATNDDGSCVYINVVGGCTIPIAFNYNVSANSDNGSCIFVPPLITLQPISSAISIGSNYTLVAAASSWGPTISYQWQFNSNNIAGATSTSYTIVSANNNKIGFYRLIATTNNGIAISNNAFISTGYCDDPTALNYGMIGTCTYSNGFSGNRGPYGGEGPYGVYKYLILTDWDNCLIGGDTANAVVGDTLLADGVRYTAYPWPDIRTNPGYSNLTDGHLVFERNGDGTATCVYGNGHYAGWIGIVYNIDYLLGVQSPGCWKGIGCCVDPPPAGPYTMFNQPGTILCNSYDF